MSEFNIINMLLAFILMVRTKLTVFFNTHVRIEIKHGDVFPKGYGWSGYNKLTDRVYAMPLGINMLYTAVTWFYYEMIQGFQSRTDSYTYVTGRKMGQLVGQQHGYMAGYIDGKNGVPNRLLELQKQEQA